MAQPATHRKIRASWFLVKDPDQLRAGYTSPRGRVTVPPAFQARLDVTVGFGADLGQNNRSNLLAVTMQWRPTFGGAIRYLASAAASRSEFYVDEIRLSRVDLPAESRQYDEYILAGARAVRRWY